MTDDLHDVLAIYSVERILEQVWWSYRWVLAVVVLWLGVTLICRRKVFGSMQIAGWRLCLRPPALDLMTIPVSLTSLGAVQAIELAATLGEPVRPALARAVWWSIFAGGLAALVMTVAFSVMAGLAARWLCGVRLSESLRLGFSGLAALGSFAVILILFWALLQPLPGAAS